MAKFSCKYKYLEKVCSWTCINFQSIKNVSYDVLKRHKKGRNAPCLAPHYIKTNNISVRSANIQLKFHVQVAKWPYINEIRTISYLVKYLLKHVLCLRIFRTAHVHVCSIKRGHISLPDYITRMKIFWQIKKKWQIIITAKTYITLRRLPLVLPTSGPIPRVLGCRLTSHFGDSKIPKYPECKLKEKKTCLWKHWCHW